MSIVTELRDLRIKRKSVLDAAGAILTRSKGKDLSSFDEQEFERRHVEGDALLTKIGRLERQLDAERGLNDAAPDRRTAGREDVTEGGDGRQSSRRHETRDRRSAARHGYDVVEDDADTVRFRSWVRGGTDKLSSEQRDILSSASHEERALSTVTGSAGQYTVPTGFVYTLETAMLYFGGIVQAATYIPTDDGRPSPMPTMNDTGNTGEIISENAAVMGATGGAAEQDPSFGVAMLNAYMFDSGIVKIPVSLFQDSAFPIEEYISDRLAERLARKLNTKCTIGSGTNEPTGILTTAPVGATAASAAALSYNDLLNILHAVDPAYRPKASWLFNDGTLKSVRKLVDGNGRPLFLAGGTTAGVNEPFPDTLFGKPIFIGQDLPNLAANSKSVIFGDLGKYKIRSVGQMVMRKLVERYADTLDVGMICYQRYDGVLLDAGTGPVKCLQMAAS